MSKEDRRNPDHATDADKEPKEADQTAPTLTPVASNRGETPDEGSVYGSSDNTGSSTNS
jgi:hypothetical protein